MLGVACLGWAWAWAIYAGPGFGWNDLTVGLTEKLFTLAPPQQPVNKAEVFGGDIRIPVDCKVIHPFKAGWRRLGGSGSDIFSLQPITEMDQRESRVSVKTLGIGRHFALFISSIHTAEAPSWAGLQSEEQSNEHWRLRIVWARRLCFHSFSVVTTEGPDIVGKVFSALSQFQVCCLDQDVPENSSRNSGKCEIVVIVRPRLEDGSGVIWAPDFHQYITFGKKLDQWRTNYIDCTFEKGILQFRKDLNNRKNKTKTTTRNETRKRDRKQNNNNDKFVLFCFGAWKWRLKILITISWTSTTFTHLCSFSAVL